MNISEVAVRSGLPAKTIRYYEEIGLLCSPRDDNGYRRFGERELHSLAFLARARALGFSIAECRNLMALYQDASRASADVKHIAQTHLQAIEQKIANLQSMRETLSHLIDQCAGDSRPDCPILKDLACSDSVMSAPTVGQAFSPSQAQLPQTTAAAQRTKYQCLHPGEEEAP